MNIERASAAPDYVTPEQVAERLRYRGHELEAKTVDQLRVDLATAIGMLKSAWAGIAERDGILVEITEGKRVSGRQSSSHYYFSREWNAVQEEVFQTASEKGFDVVSFDIPRAIALMHQELSEALDADRKDNPPDSHCPELDSMSVEFADLVIRVMVLAKAAKLDIPGALFAKKDYNKTRPFKHGKKY